MLNFKSRNGEISLLEIMSTTKNGQFIGIKNYENSKGEISTYVINGGVTYQSLASKSLLELLEERKNYPAEVVSALRNEISKSIAQPNRENLYQKIGDKEGLAFKDGTLYVFGSIVSKTTHKKSEKKERQFRNEFNQMKEELRKKLSVSKYRIFKLDKNFDSISLGGKELGIKEVEKVS